MHEFLKQIVKYLLKKFEDIRFKGKISEWARDAITCNAIKLIYVSELLQFLPFTLLRLIKSYLLSL